MKETLAFHIAALYRQFLAYTTEELKKAGLSFGQMPLIIYTGKHPGCTQADMTKMLRLDWGYSQRSVTKLADLGFLQKEYDPDRACNCLKLTERGEEAFALCHQVFTSWDQLQTDKLSEQDKQTLLLLLRKITTESC